MGNRVLDLGGFGVDVGEREVFDGIGEHGRGERYRLGRHLGLLFLVGVSWSLWSELESLEWVEALVVVVLVVSV